MDCAPRRWNSSISPWKQMCYFKTAARSGAAIGIYNPRNKIHINKHARLQLRELFLSLCSHCQPTTTELVYLCRLDSVVSAGLLWARRDCRSRTNATTQIHASLSNVSHNSIYLTLTSSFPVSVQPDCDLKLAPINMPLLKNPPCHMAASTQEGQLNIVRIMCWKPWWHGLIYGELLHPCRESWPQQPVYSL